MCLKNESNKSNTSKVLYSDIDTFSNPSDNESYGDEESDEESENKLFYVTV